VSEAGTDSLAIAKNEALNVWFVDAVEAARQLAATTITVEIAMPFRDWTSAITRPASFGRAECGKIPIS
jgi:hypothetical protein